MSKHKRSLSLVVTALIVMGLVTFSWRVKESVPPNLFNPQPLLAQSVRRNIFLQQAYQQLPDFPLENQYVNQETGQVDADNTLVSRLIRYHINVKGRPPNYRLDWKLTLADYLGVNEAMEESRYPGFDTLRENPIEGDRAAIKRLTRKQRDALVQTLVNIFNSPAPASTTPQPSKAPDLETPN